MTIAIDSRWEEMLDALVREGRYASREEAVAEAMRLLERKEEKFRALKATIEASIAEGGSHTAEEVREHLRKRREERRRSASAAE